MPSTLRSTRTTKKIYQQNFRKFTMLESEGCCTAFYPSRRAPLARIDLSSLTRPVPLPFACSRLQRSVSPGQIEIWSNGNSCYSPARRGQNARNISGKPLATPRRSQSIARGDLPQCRESIRRGDEWPGSPLPFPPQALQ